MFKKDANKAGDAGTAAEKLAVELDALVEAARNGDKAAFDQLVRRFRPRVFALALHLTGNTAEAEDITQDACLRAFAKITEFQGRSAFFTWLYRITLNRALNCMRDQKRRSVVSMEDDRVRVAVAVDSEGDPCLALELRESYTLLIRALDGLSPLLRATVVLTALQGLSHKEVAVVLGTNEGTVAWRIHEARGQLRRALDVTVDTRVPIARRDRSPASEDAGGLLGLLRLDSVFPKPAAS